MKWWTGARRDSIQSPWCCRPNGSSRTRERQSVPNERRALLLENLQATPIDRDTLFSGTPGLSIARSFRAATLRSSGKKFKVMLLDVTAAFLYGFSERPLLYGDSQRGPRFGKPSSDSTSCTNLCTGRVMLPSSGQRTWVELCENSGTKRPEELQWSSGIRVLELNWSCTSMTSWSVARNRRCKI